MNGKGAPRSVVGFEQELPDFTDCSFTTPEALADWSAVIHEGGPVRGLNRHMPAFGDALSDDEIERVIHHVWTFCTNPSWPRGDLNFPRVFFTEKAFPENEFVVTTLVNTSGAKGVGNEMQFERRLGTRNQFEMTVPFEMQQNAGGQNSGTRWSRGLGDVNVAFRRTLFASLATGTIASAGGEVALPTGKESADLGAGITVYEAFAMAGQRLGSSGFVQVHGGAEFPSDRLKQPREYYFRTAVGNSFAQNRGCGRAWTPSLEVLWAKPEREASEWDVVPQLQVSLSKLQHVLVAGGVRIPVNGREERHPQLVTYFLWDWFDGSLFEFWK